jgi:dipeptidase E
LKFENQGGETRKERLEEFLAMNPDRKVIGLPEGMLLQRKHRQLYLRGQGIAKLFQSGRTVEDLLPNQDLSTLLE